MKTWSLISTALLSGVLACSSGGQAGFNGQGDDGTSSSGASSSGASGSGGSSGTSSGSSSGTSSGASSGGITEDDGGPNIPKDAASTTLYDTSIPDGGLDQPITLTMSPFTVGPNEEVYKCQQFGNPFGHDVDLVKLDGYMDQGSHHFFLFNMDPLTTRNTTAPIQDCPGGGKEFHPFPYLSQQPGHYIVTYPQDNMGYPLVSANGLMINAHYLNTGSTPINPTVSITIYPAKAGVVTVHVGTIFLNNTFFSVPNGTVNQWFASTQTPITAENYTIFTNWSHMHKWATDFQALTNNTVFYDETNWDEPALITAAPAGVTPAPAHTSPMLPLSMTAGQSITWQCKYTNMTGMNLTFGDSAQTNVMCIYMGLYYPADTTSPSYPDIVSILNGT